MPEGMTFTSLLTLAGIVLVFGLVMFFVSRYKRCPANKRARDLRQGAAAKSAQVHLRRRRLRAGP